MHGVCSGVGRWPLIPFQLGKRHVCGRLTDGSRCCLNRRHLSQVRRPIMQFAGRIDLSKCRSVSASYLWRTPAARALDSPGSYAQFSSRLPPSLHPILRYIRCMIIHLALSSFGALPHLTRSPHTFHSHRFLRFFPSLRSRFPLPLLPPSFLSLPPLLSSPSPSPPLLCRGTSRGADVLWWMESSGVTAYDRHSLARLLPLPACTSFIS